ncbi:hypothetical protein QUC31_003364 [Theobroma cacao]
MKMELWLRNLITRFIAIAPSLLACIIGGSSGPARLIIIASVMSNRKEFVKSSLLKQLENRYRVCLSSDDLIILATICMDALNTAMLAYLAIKKERTDLRINASGTATSSTAGSQSGSIPMTLQRPDEIEDAIVCA